MVLHARIECQIECQNVRNYVSEYCVSRWGSLQESKLTTSNWDFEPDGMWLWTEPFINFHVLSPLLAIDPLYKNFVEDSAIICAKS